MGAYMDYVSYCPPSLQRLLKCLSTQGHITLTTSSYQSYKLYIILKQESKQRVEPIKTYGMGSNTQNHIWIDAHAFPSKHVPPPPLLIQHVILVFSVSNFFQYISVPASVKILNIFPSQLSNVYYNTYSVPDITTLSMLKDYKISSMDQIKSMPMLRDYKVSSIDQIKHKTLIYFLANDTQAGLTSHHL